MDFAGPTTNVDVYRCDAGQVAPIDMLHDDVLLEIFDFYVDDLVSLDGNVPIKDEVEVWQLLVHVCQRWRRVVFESPRRLKLHLVCTPGTPVPETIDVWPVLPLLIRCDYDEPISNRDNVVAALKRSDRICGIHIEDNEDLPLTNLLALMQVPFPELTYLYLRDYTTEVIPDSFLGGSVPRLRLLSFEYVPFPGLPKLLLSATHLVKLDLYETPDSGYIPPEAMVTCLSTSASLESLSFGFTTFPPGVECQPRHLSTRTVLPALTTFAFTGFSRYLEDFVARIDSPKLNDFSIRRLTYHFDPVMLQLAHFISRTPSIQDPEYFSRWTNL